MSINNILVTSSVPAESEDEMMKVRCQTVSVCPGSPSSESWIWSWLCPRCRWRRVFLSPIQSWSCASTETKIWFHSVCERSFNLQKRHRTHYNSLELKHFPFSCFDWNCGGEEKAYFTFYLEIEMKIYSSKESSLPSLVISLHLIYIYRHQPPDSIQIFMIFKYWNLIKADKS